MESKRRSITLEELKGLTNSDLRDVQVSGEIIVRDKNGNIKGRMDITSLEVSED